MIFEVLFTYIFVCEVFFLALTVITMIILKAGKKPYIVAGVIYALLIGGTVCLILYPPHTKIETTGDYEVNIKEYYVTEDVVETVRKKSRYREIPVIKYYPVNFLDENLPVIVVSNGPLETYKDNTYLCNELASNGYVVLSVGIPGQDGKNVLSDGTKVRATSDFKNELSFLQKNNDPGNAYVFYHKWMATRMCDLNAVLDDYCTKYPETEFVVAGYDIGGSASYGLARTRDDVVGAIGIDALFLYDIVGVKDGEYVFDSADYNIPIMNIYSDSFFGKIMGEEEYTNNSVFWYSSNPIYTNIHYENIYYSELNDSFHKTPVMAHVRDGGYPERKSYEQIEITSKDILAFLNKFSAEDISEEENLTDIETEETSEDTSVENETPSEENDIDEKEASEE